MIIALICAAVVIAIVLALSLARSADIGDDIQIYDEEELDEYRHQQDSLVPTLRIVPSRDLPSDKIRRVREWQGKAG